MGQTRERATNGVLNEQNYLDPEVREAAQEMSNALKVFCEKYEPSYGAWGLTYWQLQEIYRARNALRKFLEDERTPENTSRQKEAQG